MQWTDVAVAITAIYAAVVSTVNLVARLTADRPRLRVEAHFGLPCDPTWPLEWMVFVKAVNTGRVPVTVTSCGLELPTGHKLVFPHARSDKGLPCILEPGDACTVLLEVQGVAERLSEDGFSGLLNLRPYFTDATDRKYWGRALKFDVKMWLREAQSGRDDE